MLFEGLFEDSCEMEILNLYKSVHLTKMHYAMGTSSNGRALA